MECRKWGAVTSKRAGDPLQRQPPMRCLAACMPFHYQLCFALNLFCCQSCAGSAASSALCIVEKMFSDEGLIYILFQEGCRPAHGGLWLEGQWSLEFMLSGVGSYFKQTPHGTP